MTNNMKTRIALGQPIQKIYQTSRVYHGGTHSDFQYALLADGCWAFRIRTDSAHQRRTIMSWSRWRAANEQPDITDYEEVL